MRALVPGVDINRRTAIASIAAFGPLLAAGAARSGAKMAQDVVHYEATPKDGQECDQCAHFAAPHACKLVDGDISPKGWCRLWVRKSG